MSEELLHTFINQVQTRKDEQAGPKMQYVRLGRSGLKISKVILGAMNYGKLPNWQPYNQTEEEALELLEHAFRIGLNTWDTADFYQLGLSEQIIGKAIKKYNIPRPKLVIMTKCFAGVDEAVRDPEHGLNLQMAMMNDGPLVNQVGLSRKHVFDAVDASVERLGTYIDVLQIHRLDRDVPPEEIMKALNDVVESGKVRYIGASSMATWEFQMLNNIAEKNGWHKFISMQNYHNLLYREEEREMIPYCQHAGIGLIPWSPLAKGILARPHASTESERSKTDFFLSLFKSDNDKPILDRVEEIAKKMGKSMAVVAIAWSLKKGVNPILGLGSKKRIDEAVEAVGVELSDEDVKYLEEAYEPRRVSPMW